MLLKDDRKSLMLWADDFRTEKEWVAVCEALGLPDDTKEIELKVDIIAAFPYKHRVGTAVKRSNDSQLNPSSMDRTQKCIVELYRLIDRIEYGARHHDLSMIRVRGGASGCDMFQGLPPVSRIKSDILNKYEDIICDALNKNAEGTNLL